MSGPFGSAIGAALEADLATSSVDGTIWNDLARHAIEALSHGDLAGWEAALEALHPGT